MTKATKIDRISRHLAALRPPLAVLIVSAFLIPRVSADQSHASDTLTLSRCVEIARRNSPELRIAARAVDASRLDRRLAARARWPLLTFVGGAGYAPYTLHFGYDPAVSNGGELGARVIAEETLYDAGQYGLHIQSAENETARQNVSLQQQDRDLVYSVNLAFIDVLTTERQRDLRMQSAARLTEYNGLVSSMNQSGTVNYTDLLNTKVQLAQAKIDADDAERAVAGARLNLNRLLGFPDDSAVVIAGSLDSLLIVAADTATDIAGIAPARDLDLKAARLDYTRSRIALSMAKSQWKPTVSLSADAGVLTSRENLQLPASERYSSTGYSVGISLSMPVWDWNRRKIEIDRTLTQVKAAQDNVDLVKRNLLADFGETSLRLSTARRRLLSIRQAAQTADTNYLLNKAEYADGNASASDVLLAQQALANIRQSEIETLAEIQSLKARLDKITRTQQDTPHEIRP
jgi:outer membrane protein TolC